ncbi:hypothetical protein ONJ87_27550, partial [Salmonella enterica subsp. enterica serovar Anatum]|nr:hypothetical protein [Salmonella enterica subsp. enterica serovar Anatum]
RNQLTRNQSILMHLVDGPFKKLIGGWKFTPLSPEACRIEFQLPFKPTSAQARVVAEIERDMALDVPMMRLVQGDVGSGKTLVAA